jgi:hypothetical protein
VNITSSGDDGNNAYQVADHGWNSYWMSTNDPNSWICFDFKDRDVSLTNYTLKSGGADGWFPVNWVIEGSNNGMDWTTLDTQTAQTLRGKYVVDNFRCSSHRSEYFRCIRLRQTGKNSTGSDQLLLCNVEFFGKLR